MFGKKASALIFSVALTLVGWGGTALAAPDMPDANPKYKSWVSITACHPYVCNGIDKDTPPDMADSATLFEDGSMILRRGGLTLSGCAFSFMGCSPEAPGEGGLWVTIGDDNEVQIWQGLEHQTLMPVVLTSTK